MPMDPSSLVLSIECLKGSSKADEWTGDMLQTGDVVEELRIGKSIFRPPFRNGKSGVQRNLYKFFKQKETSIRVRVTRGSESFAELQACIVPAEQLAGKKEYVLRSIDDPNYVVGFVDRTEGDCRSLRASRRSRMVNALEQAPLQDGYVSYPWQTKMKENVPVPRSRTFDSILFLPKSSHTHFHDLDDTLARAQAWFDASQASTAPIVFVSIQTESLLTKVSGDIANSSTGSLSGLSNLGNTSLYGLEDYHGVDIGLVRGVRLWFSPIAGEIAVGISIGETDSNLGFTISRTEEGFIYISSVIDDDNTPASRSGLSSLYKQAASTSRLLVVSKVLNRKVLPWMVSPAGVIRCFDTVLLSQKLSLHRHTRTPIVLHMFLWDRNVNYVNAGSVRAPAMSACPLPFPLPVPTAEIHLGPQENVEEDWDDDFEINLEEEDDDIRLEKDSAGEFSFQFRDFGPTDNWV